MSHELRTPMNAILGFAQKLELNTREVLTKRQKKYIDHILNGGNHLLELIDQMLEFNVPDAGKLKLEFASAPAHQVIEVILNKLSLFHSGKH